MCVSVWSRDACELSQYDCGAAENSRAGKNAFILEEVGGEKAQGGAGGAGTWGGRFHPGWTLSPPTIKYSFRLDYCSTCSINKQIFIIVSQCVRLRDQDVKGTGPCSGDPTPIYQALSSFKGWLGFSAEHFPGHHLLGDHWFLGVGCGICFPQGQGLCLAVGKAPGRPRWFGTERQAPLEYRSA